MIPRYKAPASSHDLLKDAEANLEYQTRGKDGTYDDAIHSGAASLT